MTNIDSQRIKEIRDNTKTMAEAFSSIANTLADALELYISTRTETQTETQNSNLTFKTLEYCDICDHKGCEECIANALDEHCMPSQFNKQIEDECAKEYEELGLKELKELIEADRKTEPQKKEVEWVYNKRERLWYPYSNGDLLFKEIPNNCEHITEDGVTCAKYPACDDCLDNPLNKVKGSERLLKGKDEPQTDEEYINSLPWTEVGNGEQTDEPQTEEHCENCRHKDECEGATYEYKNTEWWCLAYAPIDEPQTDCAWK